MLDRKLLPGEFAVLGLLGLRPMHGYEMARYFDRDDLAEVCPIDQSLLYTYVRNVEERGLVAWTETRVGLRPPRKVYHLTPGGRESLDAWLETPVERLREVRLDLLLKLYFLHQTDPDRERALLSAQILVCKMYRANVEARLEAASGFARLVAASRAAAARATVAWLVDHQRALTSGTGPAVAPPVLPGGSDAFPHA